MSDAVAVAVAYEAIADGCQDLAALAMRVGSGVAQSSAQMKWNESRRALAAAAGSDLRAES
ncbi:MAG: hypothetical protein IPK26_22020 [Planctomycetes bacterium]|nr:hypothetical protein [Planctomycetota bacterium]